MAGRTSVRLHYQSTPFPYKSEAIGTIWGDECCQIAATTRPMPIPGHSIYEDTLGKLQPLGSDHAEPQAGTETHGLH